MGIDLLCISGSLRAEATNTRLLKEAVRVFAPDSFTFANLHLPLYDGDVEAQGMPESVSQLAAQIDAADAVLISTPEYNKMLSGVLKNALDWISRTPDKPLRNKPVAIMSAAAGRSGGERSQYSLRLALVPFDARVIQSPEMLLAGSGKAFDADGRLTDARALNSLTKLMETLRASIGSR